MTAAPPDDVRPDRQRQAVIAAAVVIALLAAAGLGVLLLRGDEPDRLATPSPAPSSVPPSTAPTPTAEPSASPSPSPSPSPTGWEVATAFLSPEAASTAEEPGWTVDEDTEPEPGALLDPCREGGFPLDAEVAASDERTMSSEREVGGSFLRQEVFRYADAGAATRAVAEYADRVERCPSTPVEGGPGDHTNEGTVVERADDRLLVRLRSCAPECSDLFTGYFLVARAEDGLTVAYYEVGEDGDPAEPAAALLDAAAEALAVAVRG